MTFGEEVDWSVVTVGGERGVAGAQRRFQRLREDEVAGVVAGELGRNCQLRSDSGAVSCRVMASAK